jgi:hypothetical protein
MPCTLGEIILAKNHIESLIGCGVFGEVYP